MKEKTQEKGGKCEARRTLLHEMISQKKPEKERKVFRVEGGGKEERQPKELLERKGRKASVVWQKLEAGNGSL